MNYERAKKIKMVIDSLDKMAQSKVIPVEYRMEMTFLADELRDEPIFQDLENDDHHYNPEKEMEKAEFAHDLAEGR